MTDLVITDTSCLIALDRVGQLALLPALFGTAGILLAAKRAKLLSAVKPVLDALIRQHKFRLDERLYAQVLEAAGEA